MSDLTNDAILPKKIIEKEIINICKRYKISEDQVVHQLNTSIKNYPKLIQKIHHSKNDDITRFKEYKSFIKAVKKQIYYQLRRYHQDIQRETDLNKRLLAANSSDERNEIISHLMATHISTRERMPHYPEFYNKLSDIVPSPQSIIDIGCGFHPLSYPYFDSQLKTYLAIDKDPAVIETLRIFSQHVLPVSLIAICTDINDICWTNYIEAGSSFDFAFMLKLLPVVYRHDKTVLAKLSETPANKILVTGNTESMTRKENIQKKEERIIRRFLEMTGRNITSCFQIANEFGFVI